MSMSSEPEPPACLSAEQLFRRHAPFVARFLAHLGVAPRDLEDIVQEVFLVVHARGGYVAGPAKPTSYLGSIALRAAQTHRRRRDAEHKRIGTQSADELPATAPGAVEQLEAHEDVRRIRAALATLPEPLRIPLLLVELEGESCVSVAAGMNTPLGTVYWRLHTARKLFRRALLDQEERELGPATQVREG